MKFIANSAGLAKQLSKISGIVNPSNTVPILDNFLFDIHKGNLTVFASDLETTMSFTHTIESKESGRIAIPARLLFDFIKKLPDQPITVSFDTKTFNIDISSDNGKYKFTGNDAEEYPKIPSFDGGDSFEINSHALSESLEITTFATGDDNIRQVMTGLLFEISNKNVTLVATDAHRLVRIIRSDVKAEGTASMVLPKKPLNVLKSVLKDEDLPVKIQYNKSHAFFSFGNMSVICRMIDGKYPNYETVIPKNNPNKLNIDRKNFIRSLERVAIFSNKTTYQVRLKLTGNEITISAEDLDFANEAVERLNCHYSGEDLEIGFNSKFLLEMLNALNSPEIVFELSTPNRAGIILPVADGKGTSGDLLMLVMPIMLNG